MRHYLARTLPYRPEQLFALVGDVEAYPQFIPWIRSMRTWNAAEEGAGVTRLDAKVQVRFSIVRERFSTRVRREANAGTITVSLLSGPFKRLFNRWRFSPHPRGAQIDFEIEFEFKSRLLDQILAANFHRAVDKLIACFEARAATLYEPQAAPGPI